MSARSKLIVPVSFVLAIYCSAAALAQDNQRASQYSPTAVDPDGQNFVVKTLLQICDFGIEHRVLSLFIFVGLVLANVAFGDHVRRWFGNLFQSIVKLFTPTPPFMPPKERIYRQDFDTTWKKLRQFFKEEKAHPEKLTSRWKTLDAELADGEIRLELQLQTVEKLGGSSFAIFWRLEQEKDLAAMNTGTTNLVTQIRVNLLLTSEQGDSTKIAFAWKQMEYEGLVDAKVPTAHYEKVQKSFYERIDELLVPTANEIKQTLEATFDRMLEATKAEDNARIKKYARVILELESQLHSPNCDRMKSATVAFCRVLLSEDGHETTKPVLEYFLPDLARTKCVADPSTAVLYNIIARACQKDGEYEAAVGLYSFSIGLFRAASGDYRSETAKVISEFKGLVRLANEDSTALLHPELKRQIKRAEAELSNPAPTIVKSQTN